MQFTRFIFFLLGFFFFNAQDGISQKKSTIAVAEDIFSDLPINDPSTNSVLKPGEIAADKIKKNIFVSGAFNKTTCYVGEPVLLSFELLSALKSKSTVVRLPSFDGFTTIFMDPDNSFPKFRKQQNLEFSVFAIKQVQLMADKEGSFEIGPIILNNKVDYKKDKKDYSYTGIVDSKPVRLNVRNLPKTGRPENFSGAVGNFSVKASVKLISFPIGENNTLTIEINGSGNFYSLKAPPVYWPTGFHNFEISEKEDLNNKVFPVSGNKIISIPFIAEQQGEFTIPPVELIFFDPVTGAYRKSITAGIHLIVTAPIAARKNTSLSAAGNSSQPQNNYYWLYIIATCIIVPIVVFVAIKQLKKNKIRNRLLAAELLKKSEQDEIEKIKRDKLNAAAKAVADLDNLKPGEKYVFTFKKTFIDYLHLRLDIPDALPEEMSESLRVIDASAANQLKQLLEECDMLLYTGILPDNIAIERMIGLLHSIIEKVNQYPT
jgi:hypothetical protein